MLHKIDELLNKEEYVMQRQLYEFVEDKTIWLVDMELYSEQHVEFTLSILTIIK